MNQGQERFYQFILDRVDDNKQDAAKELLMESFSKQDDGSFNKEYLISFMPRMMELIKPEYLEEVTNTMANFNHR